MRQPGFHTSLAISFFLHSLIAAVTFLAVRQPYLSKPSTPYIVSLVESAATENAFQQSSGQTQASAETARPKEKPVKQEAVKSAKDSKSQAKEAAKQKESDKLVSERIAALEAKKKIERIVAIRKLVDIQGQSSGAASTSGSGPKNIQTSGSISSSGDYYLAVVDKIRKHWIFPDNIDKALEAIISINIERDGRVTINKIEKSSGNQLFDRSAMRAINNASPLPPPPQELEIGVRFKP